MTLRELIPGIKWSHCGGALWILLWLGMNTSEHGLKLVNVSRSLFHNRILYKLMTFLLNHPTKWYTWDRVSHPIQLKMASASNASANPYGFELNLETTCHSYIPGVHTSYGYVPSLTAGIIFVVLFCLSALAHTVQAIMTRRWWCLAFMIGALSMLDVHSSKSSTALC